MMMSPNELVNLSQQIRELDKRINKLARKKAQAATISNKLSFEINGLIAKQLDENQHVREFVSHTSANYHL